ncbi:MAG: hypothetical protein IJ306_03225 [Oscillospiraceae bacterium]|nr:hypothetical protein [Oscillospiraceae bacterium]
MKKFLSLLIAVITVFGVLPQTVLAAGAQFSAAADKTEAEIGETVEVTFVISGNPGFTNIELTLDFDKEVLKFTGLKIDPDTESYEGRFGGGATVANTDPESEKYGFVTNARASATSADGKLFVAVFEVIGSGETAIGADITLMENSGNAAEFSPSAVPSEKVSVKGAPEPGVLYGDLNGDGKINVMDANLIRRASAKLIELDENQHEAAEVSGDGKVNVMDANLVRRFSAKLISKFPVEG